jgi:subtilisin family serine protease
VAGTLNIHWQAVAGPFTPCTGIEFTNGTLADASDGSVTMAGTSVSNPQCVGTATYQFTLTSDTTQLIGADTLSNVPMTLTRGPGQACFVGTWTQVADVFEAYIWAGAFPLIPAQVPTLGSLSLALLMALMGFAGAMVMRRRHP